MTCKTCNGAAQTQFVNYSDGRLCWTPCTECKAGKLRDVEMQLHQAQFALKRASTVVKKHLNTIDELRVRQLGIQLGIQPSKGK